jgi:hypothetical protein
MSIIIIISNKSCRLEIYLNRNISFTNFYWVNFFKGVTSPASRSASHEIYFFSWNTYVQYHIQNSTLVVPIPIQVYVVHIFKPCFRLYSQLVSSLQIFRPKLRVHWASVFITLK